MPKSLEQQQAQPKGGREEPLEEKRPEPKHADSFVASQSFCINSPTPALTGARPVSIDMETERRRGVECSAIGLALPT